MYSFTIAQFLEKQIFNCKSLEDFACFKKADNKYTFTYFINKINENEQVLSLKEDDNLSETKVIISIYDLDNKHILEATAYPLKNADGYPLVEAESINNKQSFGVEVLSDYEYGAIIHHYQYKQIELNKTNPLIQQFVQLAKKAI